jgi:hypothetical protein
VPTAHAPRCDSNQEPSQLSVAPFAPALHQLPPSSRLPLRATVIGPRPVKIKPGLRAFRIRRGSLLRYEIALTNSSERPFRFHGCPVYIEQLSPSVPQQAYVLNCRPAGQLAPGATVLFQMLLQIPRTARLGNNGLAWELAPQTYEAPFAPAAVWVVR